MNDVLRDELLQMAAADLKVFADLEVAASASSELRTRIDARSQAGSSSPAWPVEWTDEPPLEIVRLQTVVDRNTQRMKEIVSEVGWPGHSLVGAEGAAAAWLVIHHTVDLDLQRTCLELLSEAVERGDADRVHLEWLTDRVLLREGRPETYGTHAGARGQPPAPALLPNSGPRNGPSSP